MDHDINRVLRRNRAGLVKWSTPLDGDLGLIRPPHLQADAARVYITHTDGVTALDAASGAMVWHSSGPADRLLLSGNLLLAADCSSEESTGFTQRWLLARATATGAEAFRVKLPRDDFDPLPIRELVGFYLVQGFSEEKALLIDRVGRVRLQFDREIIAGVRRPGGCLFLTSRDVARTSDDDRLLWSIPFSNDTSPDGGGLLLLPEGDWLAYLYCSRSARLVRFDPDTGRKVWESACNTLEVDEWWGGVFDTIVTVREGRLTITSRCSLGTFVEVLDAQTGLRMRKDPIR